MDFAISNPKFSTDFQYLSKELPPETDAAAVVASSDRNAGGRGGAWVAQSSRSNLTCRARKLVHTGARREGSAAAAGRDGVPENSCIGSGPRQRIVTLRKNVHSNKSNVVTKQAAAPTIFEWRVRIRRMRGVATRRGTSENIRRTNYVNTWWDYKILHYW